MRIAWYSHRYHPCIGGAETYGRAMIRRFVAAGCDVDVFTSDAKDLWYFNDRSRARLVGDRRSIVDGATVNRFPVRHIPFQRYVGKLLSFVPHWPTQCRYASYMPLIPELGKVRGAFDAVVAVGFPFTVFAFEALRTARRCGAPLILTPFLHLATPGDPVHRTYTRPHQIRLLREADAVVVVTRLEAEAVASWGIDPSKIVLVPMGIEPGAVTGGVGDRFREEFRISPGRPLIGHLATLDENKGSNDLVRAVIGLNETRPADDPVFLALCGVSSPDFERFAASLPASTRRWLIQTGPLDDRQKRDFFAAIDLFSMPSRTDSFGLVFLEAWANGKAVVAASAGGVREVIHHDVDGLLVCFGDVDRLRLALEWLLLHPETARRLGDAGRIRVASGCRWEDGFAKLSATIDSLRDHTMERQGRSERPISAPHRTRSRQTDHVRR